MNKLLYPFPIAILILFSYSKPAIAQTWEAYDLQGKLKSRAIYNDIKILGESVMFGKNSNGLFLISPELKPIVTLDGEDVYQYLAPWIIVKGSKGIGAYHEYGQQVLKTEYDEIQTYITRLLARKGKEYWIFERGTNRLIPLGTLDHAKITQHGLVITQKSGSYYLPQSNTPEKAYELLQENDGRYLLAKEGSGYGLINIEGDYVMDPTLDQLEYSRNDHFYGYEQNQYILIKGDDINADISYNSYHKITKEGDLMLEYIHGKLRRVMQEGGILLDIVGMEEVKLIAKDHYFIRFRDNKTGLLGKKGWLVEPKADASWIGVGQEGLFPASKSGLTGFVNSSGQWVINPTYSEVKVFSDQIAEFKDSNAWGLVSSSGQILVSPQWEDIKPFSQGMAIAKNTEGLFLIDRTGNKLNSTAYDQICRIKDGYFLVEKSGKRGLLDFNGKEIQAPEFDFIQVENKDFILLAKEGKFGVVKESGDVVFPLNYQEIIPDWTNSQVLVKELYTPIVIPIVEPSTTSGKRKKGA